ncbi:MULTISPECIES: LysR family transcriptional regulator [Methylosinus]|nr:MULTISPECIES: LysR family transcriptional regulator [Methylosinus]OBS51393.1 hypothetical protein A8B73_16695 [Methylosinus sp. 3S-1]
MIEADIDWTLWRSFLAIVREGSLAGAARALRVSHPTIRRHLEALETRLKTPLFTRSPSGLEPTAVALDLRPVAEAMEASSRALLRRALSERDELAGVVRLTASDVVAVEVLPRLLAPLRSRHPRLSFEIHPSNRIEDILRGDADIALRMTRPRQKNLIAQHIAGVEIGLFATKSLVDSLPNVPATLAEAVASGWMIGYDRKTAIIEAMEPLGVEAKREDFHIRSDDDLAHLAAVRAGLGMGFIQAPLALRTPDLIRMLPELKLDMELWLAVHPQLIGVPRIAATMKALKPGLKRFSRIGVV